MRKKLFTFLSLFALSMNLTGQSPKVMLNFEESEHFNVTDMTEPVDNIAVDNELLASVFDVQLFTGNLGSPTPPRYAIAGGSFLAFTSPNGKDCYGQAFTNVRNYIKDDKTNCFFVTDYSTNQDIFIDVDESMLQVNRVVFDLLDIDALEVLVVDVYAVGQADVYTSRVYSSGDPGTGNAVATNVSIIIENEVIDYIHIRSSTPALIGVDNILFENMECSSSFCDIISNFEDNENCEDIVICKKSTSISSEPIVNYLWVLTNVGAYDVVGTYSSASPNLRMCLEGEMCPDDVDINVEPTEALYELCLYVEDERGCLDKHCEIFEFHPEFGLDIPENSFSKKSLTQLEELKASPNPFRNELSLSFEMDQPGNVDMRIYNSHMQPVGKIGKNDYYQIGKHTIKWNPTFDLTSGVYFVQFSFDQGQKVVRKVMHVR